MKERYRVMDNVQYVLNEKQRKYQFIKRLFDIVLCIPICITLLPFMVIFAVAIKLDSKGPILFKQT